MNIVISGATGYLGGKLAERFINTDASLSESHHVLLLARDKVKLSHCLLQNKNVTVCGAGDETMAEGIKSFSPDIIYSTTCQYEMGADYLPKTIDANYVFPSRLLRIASDLNKNIRFISIGTGLPPSLNLYTLTKKQFAEIGKYFYQLGKLDFINIELENFYGSDEPQNRFIMKSILQLLANQELLLTEGTQKRDFILIDDVLDIMHFLLSCPMPPSCDISIGSGIAPSIKEIIQFLREQTSSASVLKWGAVPMRKNEPSTVANLSVLRSLGYTKQITSWKEGMKKVIGALK
jgi:CDP-paratose synthetase